MLLMASSASKSYHSKGAELGDGTEGALVNGESKKPSGEFVRSLGSVSLVIDFLIQEGDRAVVMVSSLFALCAELVALALDSACDSVAETYRHSLSDFVHVKH